MGNSSSADSRSKKSSNLYKRVYSDPSFWQRSAGTPFIKISDYISQPVKSPISPADLSYLLLGCYEQLSNIPQLLETIIKEQDNLSSKVTENQDTPDFLLTLRSNYSYYNKIEDVSTAIIGASSFYTGKMFSPWSFTPPRHGNKLVQPSFMQILDAIQIAIDSLTIKKVDIAAVESVATFFKLVSPPSAFPPPSKEFFPKNPIGHFITMPTKFVATHGMATNGRFLFILVSDGILQIFPLFNHAAISSPIFRQLNIKFGNDASLITRGDLLQIYYSKQVFTYTIDAILATDAEPRPKVDPLEKNYFAVLSDGISHCFVEQNFVVHVYDSNTNKLTRTVQLHAGNSPLSKDLRELFPAMADYHQIPMAMNGVFIGMLFRVQQFTSLLRVFSLVTGEHVLDDNYSCNEQFYSIMTDMNTRSMWTIVGPRLTLKKYYFAGSLNPKLFGMTPLTHQVAKIKQSNCFKELTYVLQKNLIHLVGSQIIPKALLPEKDHRQQIDRLIDIIIGYVNTNRKVSDKLIPFMKSMLQALLVILDVNLKAIEVVSKFGPELVNRLLDMLTFLPSELRTFIFFNHLSMFIIKDEERHVNEFALSMMCSILEKLTDEDLIQWALSRIVVSGILSHISLTRDNTIRILVPESLKDPQCKPIFTSLLLLHQHALITAALDTLKRDPFLPVAVSAKDADEMNQLHIFGEYINFIISKFDAAISEVTSEDELVNSVIFILFKELVDGLSSLTKFHTVAQVATSLFHVLLTKIGEFITRIGFNPSDDGKLSILIKEFLFLFAQFAATLVKGGVLSVFEERFIWLVRANIDIVDRYNITTITDEDFEPLNMDKMNDFILGNYEIMPVIYKKFKPLQNKNLKENIQRLDRLSMAAFSIHTECVSDLMNLNNSQTLNDKLRKCVEQMFRIRNTVRELMQNGKESEVKVIENRLRMLIRMKSNFNGIENPSVLLGDFVLCDTPPESIMKILAQQRSRIQTTLVGFNLIDSTYNMKIHPQYNDIISYALSKIERFDGLSSIMKMTPLNDVQKKQIESFFHRILSLIKADIDTDKWILVAYRFFRDIDLFDDIKRFFLDGILEAFSQTPARFSLFALCFSLIPSIIELPQSLSNIDNIQPIRYILLSEALRFIDCPLELFQQYNGMFWTVKSDLARLTCRTMFYMLASKNISDEEVEKTISRMIRFIGENVLNNVHIPFCNEMTWIVRRMIVSKHRAAPIVKRIIHSFNIDSDKYDICGALTIIGSYVEKLRPYCNVKYHSNRNSVFECIAIQQVNEEKYTYYYMFHRPFNIMSQYIQVRITPETMIYAVPMIILDPKEFDFDFIISFFDYAFNQASKVTESVYMQVLALFCNEPGFVEKLNNRHMKKLVECPLPFSDISHTLTEIEKFGNLKTLPTVSGFSQMRYKDNEYISYISPQISAEAPAFTVTINTPPGQMKCFVGVISSCVDKHHTRYSLVSIPEGETYPIETMSQLNVPQSTTSLTVTFNIKAASFKIGNAVYFFPDGKAFKIIVAMHKSIQFDVNVPQAASVFDTNTTPPQIQRGCIDFDEERPLFNIPSWAQGNVQLSHDITKMKSSSIYIGRLSTDEKLMSNFVPPPQYISIHIGFTSEASDSLVNEQVRGLYKQLSLQWSTIVLMRILLLKQELITSERLMMKLVSLLTVMLESFIPSEFELQKFPFSLTTPIWGKAAHTNILYMGLEQESLKALKIFVQRPQFISALCTGLQAMARSERMHLIARPCRSHHYFAPPKDKDKPVNWKDKPIEFKCSSNCIIAPNDFHGFIPDTIRFRSSTSQELYPAPAIIPLSDPPHMIVIQGVNRREFSVFDINPMNNTWIYDTAFEMLLLLKNFVFIAQSDEERAAAKRILLECFIIQSPFIYNYLPQFADLMQIQIPITPFDDNLQYKQLLAVVASMLQNRKDFVSQRFHILYLHDQHVLTSTENKRISMYFPEFFTKKFEPATDDKIMIPDAVTDPGAIRGNFPGYILMLRQFARQYKSLEGFPFWEILPLWFRISGSFKGSGDYIDPTLTITSPTTLHVANPSGLEIEIKFTKTGRISHEMYIFRSNNAEFDNPAIISEQDLKNIINTREQDLFFSIIGNHHDTWNNIKPTLTCLTKKPLAKQAALSNLVSVSSIKSRFIDDMHQFAIDWTPSDTEELISILPRISLREPTFPAIENISKGCSLCSKFSPTVVVLHALLIHHFNYIRYNYYKNVPQNLWNSMTCFLSAEDAADAIISQINLSPETIYPTLTIDRHTAHRLVTNGNGDPMYSIISQLSRILRGIDPKRLCCKKRPWKVNFVGEMAVDAGGPGRELLTEAAASIFEPTTMLAIPTPNMRNHTGQYKDVYIPFDKSMSRGVDYYTIGVLLGIIIRTGLQQDIPFAPIVWKYIANERIGIDDVTAIDSGLAEHFKHMKAVSEDADFAVHYAFQWKVDDWDGTKVMLPGHDKTQIIQKEDVEQYIKECIDFRLFSITQCMRSIRTGFRANTGFKHNSLMTGALLSRMAQGSGDISVHHLKQITQVADFEEGIKNEYVQRFFRSVEKLNKEQRKLLLKFITTLTRLPNSTLIPDFKLKIDMKDCPKPDETLPTASTCFNKLHLPKYSTDEICLQKLLVAIQYCQTMEEK